NPLIACPPAMGKLEWQDYERRTVACPAYMQSAADARQAHLARRDQGKGRLGFEDRLAAEIEIGPAQYLRDFGARPGRLNIGRAVIADIGMGKFVHEPVALFVLR